MSEPLRIVTHAGQAHADDLLAVALILIKENAIQPGAALIERFSDGKAEEWDFADFVVDIGRKYDASKGWFDHHQFPSDAPPDCAFTLVAEHYGIKRNSLRWIERVAVLDSKGPWVWFEKAIGRPAKNMAEIDSLLCGDVFSWFTRTANQSYKNEHAFRDALNMTIPWLQNELAYIDSRERNVGYARNNLKIVDLGSFKIAYFNQKEMKGVGELCDIITTEDPSIIVSCKPDDRGDGYSATRLNNQLRVDFHPREGETNCVFAHVNGFCLKWKNDWDSFVDAVKRSVKEA